MVMPYKITPILNNLLWSFLMGYFMIASFTLLCAILFKTYKVLKTIGIYLGLNLVIGNIQTILWGNRLMQAINDADMQSLEHDVPMNIVDLTVESMTYGMIFSIVAFIALSVAIYYRLRTVKS